MLSFEIILKLCVKSMKWRKEIAKMRRGSVERSLIIIIIIIINNNKIIIILLIKLNNNNITII